MCKRFVCEEVVKYLCKSVTELCVRKLCVKELCVQELRVPNLCKAVLPSHAVETRAGRSTVTRT